MDISIHAVSPPLNLETGAAAATAVCAIARPMEQKAAHAIKTDRKDVRIIEKSSPGLGVLTQAAAEVYVSLLAASTVWPKRFIFHGLAVR
ncbi:MAG TPA: hypothetical protein VLJ58_06205 [Ramlibacter sp.]|nr:hypothetical protein [Ramlibacter sp.]